MTDTYKEAYIEEANEHLLELDPERIEPPPRIGIQIKTDFIKGMGKRNDHFIIILDIDRLFTSEELACATDAKEEVSL